MIRLTRSADGQIESERERPPGEEERYSTAVQCSKLSESLHFRRWHSISLDGDTMSQYSTNIDLIRAGRYSPKRHGQGASIKDGDEDE